MLAVSIAFGACGVAAPAALAAPFQRDDVFMFGNGGVQEYSPTGQLLQTIAGASRGTTLCFDPSGKHLIVPGSGLFDSSGNLLPSNWASVTVGYHCVVDGLGNVYVSGKSGAPLSTVVKYSLTGTPIQTFTVAPYPVNGFEDTAIDLAPDECSLYWGVWNGILSTSGQLNVCTNTEEPPVIANAYADDLRVLPNWQELVLDDPAADLYGTSGQIVRFYSPDIGNSLRYLAVDPGGASFWMSDGFGAGVWQFDVNTGQQLESWVGSGGGQIAVYGPPLVGTADVESHMDLNAAGTAEAFPTTVGYPGEMSSLDLYVDSTSVASQIDVGVYADKSGAPGTLEDEGTITSVRAGSWNDVILPSSLSVSAGQQVWIAILAPKRDGKIRFRDDAHSGAGSITSAKTNLTALPTTWSSGTRWTTGNLSAYGN